MADEKKEGLDPSQEESETSEDSSPKETDGEKAEEEKDPQIPLSRLRESEDKRKELEKELLLTRKQEIPEDEKKVREVMDKRDKELVEGHKKAEIEQKESVDGLHEIWGEFDDKKFVKFAEDNPIRSEDGGLDYERIMTLFQRVGEEGAPSVKKTPSSERTGDVAHKEPFDPTKYRSMQEIAAEAEKENPEK